MFERFRRNQRDDEGVSGARDLGDRDGRAAPEYAGVATTRDPETGETRTAAAPATTARDTGQTDVMPRRSYERGGDREVATGPAVSDVRARQRAEFGGTNWGSAF